VILRTDHTLDRKSKVPAETQQRIHTVQTHQNLGKVGARFPSTGKRRVTRRPGREAGTRGEMDLSWERIRKPGQGAEIRRKLKKDFLHHASVGVHHHPL